MYNRFLSTAGYVRRGRGNVGARFCVSRSVLFINAISFSISCRRRREPTCPCLQPGVVTSLGQHRNRAGTKSAVHDWLVLVSWRRGVVVLCLPWATRSNSRRFNIRSERVHIGLQRCQGWSSGRWQTSLHRIYNSVLATRGGFARKTNRSPPLPLRLSFRW